VARIEIIHFVPGEDSSSITVCFLDEAGRIAEPAGELFYRSDIIGSGRLDLAGAARLKECLRFDRLPKRRGACPPERYLIRVILRHRGRVIEGTRRGGFRC
jgi:hypothetical protein